MHFGIIFIRIPCTRISCEEHQLVIKKNLSVTIGWSLDRFYCLCSSVIFIRRLPCIDLQPTLAMASNLLAMASNLLAMASKLL